MTQIKTSKGGEVSERTIEMAGQRAELADLLDRLDELNRVGIALSAEKNEHTLLKQILGTACRITRADAGTLYLRRGEQLFFEVVMNQSLGIDVRASDPNTPFQPLDLYDSYGRPNLHMMAVYCTLTGEGINIPDAYASQAFDFSGARAFDMRTGYRTRSMLTVPLKDNDNKVIGVLQLLNATHPQAGIVAFSATDQQLTESLASQAAVALTNHSLLRQHEALLLSFIEMINAAIDEKSHYTGAHCQRVPTLTMLLADAAIRAESGPFRDFTMTEADRYQLNIAGMLHDCGKITTPVHIVDKATKLEKIFDRIHLIDTRFEILRRDLELAWLRSHPQETDRSALEAELAALEEDRAFIARANIGSEYMADADCERIRQIAQRRYQDARGQWQPLIDPDELMNLCIRRGTLNEEDRGIINNHIVVTIRMLESLPWPAHLNKVAEYAGGHHERMDGKGYPRGLTGAQMSLPARMMAIADIFEALTAADRPYKKAKTLSEALTILGRMKLDGHIDPDLFDLFVQEKIYLRYAEQFLDRMQIDAIDPEKIPGYQAKN